MAGYTGLATGAGAAGGLETLLARLRAEEVLADTQKRTDIYGTESATRNELSRRTQDRLDRSSDLANQRTELGLGLLREITGFNREPVGRGATPVSLVGEDEGADLSNRDSVPVPSAEGPREVTSGFSRVDSMNNPGGRAALQIAGLNPNEMYGTVKTPTEPKPENLTPEERFYNKRAKALGLNSMDDMDDKQYAQARNDWMKQTPHGQSFYSEPMVQVDDPENPGQTVYRPRSQAVGQPGPRPAGAREKIQAYNDTLDLIDEIEEAGKRANWQGLGFLVGPAKSFIKSSTGYGSNDEETLRDLIGQLKARASFQEGGKQFTGTEKQLLDAFLTGINQDPSAAITRLRNFKQSAERSLLAAGGKRDKRVVGGGPNTDGTDGGGGDLYEQYLRRTTTTKPGGGGR